MIIDLDLDQEPESTKKRNLDVKKGYRKDERIKNNMGLLTISNTVLNAYVGDSKRFAISIEIIFMLGIYSNNLIPNHDLANRNSVTQ